MEPATHFGATIGPIADAVGQGLGAATFVRVRTETPAASREWRLGSQSVSLGLTPGKRNEGPSNFDKLISRCEGQRIGTPRPKTMGLSEFHVSRSFQFGLTSAPMVPHLVNLRLHKFLL
jgi:hypothetical protein